MKIAKVLLGVVLAVSLMGIAQDKKVAPVKEHEHEREVHSTVQPSPEWDKIKSLAGDWEGKAGEMKVTSSYKVTGAGSAVMMMLPGEKPGDEMVTIFHPDGKNLLVTHYCSSMNQPRMKMVPSSNPNEIRFTFLDATNLADANIGHMTGLALIFDGQDHHVQEWTYSDHGKTMTEKFDMKRKK